MVFWRRRSQRFPGIFKIDPGDGDGTTFQRMAALTTWTPSMWFDRRARSPKQVVSVQDQRQHAFGQAGGSKYLHFRKRESHL